MPKQNSAPERAPTVSVNPNLWSAVTGRVEGSESLETLAFQEIREETGLRRKNLRLVRRGRAYEFPIGRGVETLVQPFLFDSGTTRVKLNWEHTDSRWVKPADLWRFSLIPRFDLTLKAVDLM